MAIKFNVHEIGKPGDPGAPKKFYARPVHSGEISLEGLAQRISHSSSVTESDVHAVLLSLVGEIPHYLSLGYIVRLGQLGSFRLGTKSIGSESADEVSGANIVQARLIFQSGKRIKASMRGLSFRK